MMVISLTKENSYVLSNFSSFSLLSMEGVCFLLLVSSVTGLYSSGSGELSLSNSHDDSLLAGVDVASTIRVTAPEERESDASVRVSLSNGKFASIRVLPATASARALSEMNASCAEHDCFIELKEVGSGKNARALYRVHALKPARVFGFINTTMEVRADVSVETGEVVNIDKPWWAFLAVEAG